MRSIYSYPFIAIFGLILFTLNNAQSQCSGNYYDHAGSSSNYSNNRNDVTTFTATSGSVMKVQFTAFNTETGYDKLYVYDGSSTSATLIYTLQGTSIPNDIISSGQYLTFKFVSDGSVTYSGWAATLSCVSSCSNITNAGSISGNQSECGSFNPTNITNSSTPTGGTGTIEYQWQSNTTGSWNVISGATSSTYDPASISVTTQYRRQAKRNSCTTYLSSNVITKTVGVNNNITLSNATVSSCINQPLQDIANVSVQVSWPSNIGNKISVILGEKIEYIDPATVSSPRTITFLIPADGTSQNITANWDNNAGGCDPFVSITAPVACSNDQLSCDILYLCGLDKPYDGDPFDHGLINYIVSVSSGTLLPVLTKDDASGLGFYDTANQNTALTVNINDYDLIIVSPTTEDHISQDLKIALESFSGNILNMNYDIQDDLGTIIGNGTYRDGDYGYNNAAAQKVLYNYDNPTAYAGVLITGGNPKSGSNNSLWYYSGNANGTTNVASYSFNANSISGVTSTHGNRIYLGYHMNGIYGNPTNGGALPAPISSYFSPTKHLTLDGKLILDQVLVSAASCNADVCSERVNNGLIASYNFKEGTGNTVYDVSGYGLPDNLTIQDPANTNWITGCGISVNSNTIIKTNGATSKVVSSIKAANAFTIETWVKARNNTQNGPARIASISNDQNNRNVTLGQEGSKFAIRNRTSTTSFNGIPEMQAGSVSTSHMQHYVYTWSGTTNIEKILVDGDVVYSGTRLGDLSNWDNSYAFALANEISEDRAWLGDIYMVAIYNKALSETEVFQNYNVGACCDGNGPPSGFLYDCEDGKNIEMKIAGIKNNVPYSFNVGSTTDIDSILVEIVYKSSNPGATISIQDASNNTYTASRNSVGVGAFVYSFILPPTSTINYTNATNKSAAQSMTAYLFKSNQVGSSYVSQFTIIGGYNSTQTINYIVPDRTETQDIVIKLPVSELTYDDRILTFTATMGGITKTITKKWGPNGLNFPNGCCIDEVEIILEDVPPTENNLIIDVYSPNNTGQSYVIAGLVFVEIRCFGEEICDNGIDDDGDGLIDCADPDCVESLNGEFDEGFGVWEYGVDPSVSGTISIDNTNQLSGANSAKIQINSTNGTSWLASLYQRNMTFWAGKTYEISFIAKASVNRNIELAVHEQNSPYTGFVYEIVDLSTTQQSYKYYYTATATYNDIVKLVIHLAGSPGTVYIDKVSIKEVCTEICGNGIDDDGDGLLDCEDLDCGQIQNRNFDAGTANWFIYNQTGNSSTFTIDDTYQANGRNSAYINVLTSNGTTDWHTQFGQTGLSIENGKNYTVTFQAKATASKPISVGLQLNSSPYTGYFSQALTLSTTLETYTYSFYSTNTINGNLNLLFNLGASTADVWIDNVQVKESCEPTGEDTVFLDAECAIVGSDFTIVSDASASGGEYVLYSGLPNLFSSTINQNEYIRFLAPVQTAGKYNIFGRTQISSFLTDSYFVRVNNGDWVQWNNIPTSSAWTWNQVKDSQSGDAAVLFDFNIGINTVDIAYRESGTKLDKIYITTSNTAPTGLGSSSANCPQKFLCDSKFYQTIEVDDDYWLYEVRTQPSMGHFPLANLTANGIIDGVNSTVFNRYDGYIYTMNMTPPHRLYRIAGDYSVHYVGNITGIPSSAFMNAADVGVDNKMYIRDASNSDIYLLDLTDLSSLNATLACDFPNVTGIQNNVGDLAYNPDNGKFYGTRDNSNQLLAYDVANCTVSTINTSVNMSSANGAFYISADGTGYGYQNSTGILLRIDLTSGLVDTVGASIPTSQTDGCSCEGLKFFKDVSSTCVIEDSIVIFEYNMFNNWFADLTNVSFNDTLSNGLTWASEPYNVVGGTIGSSSINGNAIANFTINSFPRGEVSFKIKAKIPKNYVGPNPNMSQAYLRNLPGILVPYKKSDYPATAAIDDATPLYINQPIEIAGGNNLCLGSTTTVTPNAGGTWVSNNPSVATITNGGVITSVSAGNATFTYTSSVGKCVFTSQTLTVRARPTVSISTASDFCLKTGMQLTATPSGGTGSKSYSWTGPNNFTGNTQIISVTNNGTYYVTVTDAMGCTGTAQTVVFQQYVPTIITLNTTVCEGETVNLAVNSPSAVSYLWSANAGSQTTATVTVTPSPPSTLYKVTVTNNTQCTAVPEVTINVNPKPTLTVNGPTSLCISETSNLQASVAGNWTALNPTIANVNSSGTITALSAGSARFLFTSSATSCKSDTSVVFTVKPKPTISLTGPSTICKTSTTQLSPATGGTWVSSNPSVATVNNQGLVTGVNAGTAFFTFTSSSTGCSSNPSTQVTIENGNGSTISGPIAICAGNTGQLSASPSGGSWVSLNPTIATVNSSGLVTAVSEGIAQIQYTHNSGSCSNETVYNITINQTPNVTITSSNVTCSENNGSITFTFANHPTRTNLKLSINNGATYTTVADASGSYTFTNLAVATYNLSAKWDDNDCNISLGQVTLIDNNPSPQAVISHTDEPCGTTSGGTITLQITDNPTRTHLVISLDGGATWPYTVTDNIGTYTIPNLSPGTYNISTKWTDNSCTKVKGSVTILSGYANVGTISPSDTICYGASKTLVASGGTSYLWSNGSTNTSITVSPTTTQTYSVTVSQGNGCSATKSSTVMVVGQMNVSMNFKGGLCLTDTTQITAVHTGGLAPYTYTWAGPNGSAGSTKIINISSGGNYYVTVTDKIGCTATTSGFIYQRYEPFIVNLQTQVCEGTSVDLTLNASNAIAYQWSQNAGSATTSFVTMTPTPPSSTYYVTVTNDIGCLAVAEANINVYAAPVVTLSGDDEICVGATTQLSPSGNGYWASTNQSVAQANNAGLVTGFSAGTADFYYTETTNYCTSLNPIPITVLTDTIQGFVDNEMCIGDTLYLSPNSGGAWNTTNTSVFSVSPSGRVVALAAGNGKFQFTPTGSICKATTINEMTVNPKPVISIGGGSNICIGSTSYILPSSGGSWVSNNPSVASIDNSGLITGVGIGSATFTFANSDTGCNSDESSAITVSSNPVPTVNGPTDICVGSNTYLLPNSGGVWQSTNNSIASVTSDGTVTGVYPGIAKFIFVADGGYCISDTSEAITVLAKPVISINGDNSLCIGETTSFIPSIVGDWKSSNDNIATISNTGIVTAIASGVATFTFKNATSGCTSEPSAPINVFGKPVIALTGNDSICIGSITTLSPSSGGVWTSSNSNVANISSSGIVTGLSAGTVTFSFKENQNDCSSEASLPITILPRPVIAVTGPNEICEGSTTTLSPTSGGYWISSNSYVATVSESGLVSGINQGLVKFTFISNFGCASLESSPIIVKGKPNPIFLGTPSICVGGTINLMPSTGGTWTSSDTSVASITNSGTVTGKKSGVATFIFYDTNTGCTSLPSAALTVNSLPVINVPAGSRLCVGASLQISPTSGGVWQSTNPSVAIISNSGVITGVSAGSAQFYYQSIATGCISANSVPVTVDPKPAIALNGPASICIGDTTYMTPNSGGSWESINSTIASITTNGTVIGISGGIAKFKFTSTNGCSSNLSSPITVNPAPSVGLLGQQFICIGSTTSLFPSSGGTWTSSDESRATITNSGVVMGISEGSVYFTFTDNMTGCQSDGNLQVNILAPPSISLDGDSEICIGYTTKVSSSSNGYWVSSDNRIAAVSNNGTVTGVAPGVVHITFVDGLTGCNNEGNGIEITIGKCLNPDFNVTLTDVEVSGDLSTNDLTPLNGQYDDFTILKSKPAGSIYTLNVNPDGTYTFSANKKGKYIFDIQVCIPPIDFGCPKAILEITVIGDVYSQNNPVNNLEFVTTFANGNTTLQGDNIDYNAIGNDMCVNSLGCNLQTGSTNITIGAINGTNSILPNGNISYTPGIGYIGHEEITYSICSDGLPSTCSSSTTFVTISSPTAKNSLDAPDDFNYTLTGVPVSGNVMNNDTDPEGDNIAVVPQGSSASPISTADGAYYINSVGDYTFIPNSDFSGPTSFVYTVCDDNANSVCMDATVHIIVLGDMTLKIKLYLEGALMNNNNNVSSKGQPLMRDDLRVSPFDGKRYIPATDPYTHGVGIFASSVKNHVGAGLIPSNTVITDSVAVFSVTGENAIVDWVYVELRSKSDMTSTIASRSGLLQRDGDVVELDGVSPLRFNGISVDSFYVMVSHRTHLGVISQLVSNIQTIDFTNPSTRTYNFGTYGLNGYDYEGLTFNSNVKNGYNALWAGDCNSNGVIGFIGGDDDSNTIITDVLLYPTNVEFKANFDFAYGYFNGDFDMNSKVKFTNPSDDTNMLFTQLLLYKLNSTFASNFSFMIEQVPHRTN